VSPMTNRRAHSESGLRGFAQIPVVVLVVPTLFKRTVFLRFLLAGLRVSLLIGSELMIKESVVSVVQMAREELGIPRTVSLLADAIAARESFHFRIHLSPPLRGFLLMNKISDEDLGLAEIKPNFIAVANRLGIGVAAISPELVIMFLHPCSLRDWLMKPMFFRLQGCEL
jgi:hypothetical protein